MIIKRLRRLAGIRHHGQGVFRRGHGQRRHILHRSGHFRRQGGGLNRVNRHQGQPAGLTLPTLLRRNKGVALVLKELKQFRIGQGVGQSRPGKPGKDKDNSRKT